MNGRPTVSVCIANYNGLEIVDGCIASVLAQDCGFPVEIIIHDDASIDGSVQHIRSRYPGIRLLESAENVGFCVANNRMAEQATGEYLLLLNNDAELHRDALATLFKAARDISQPAILSLPQYDFDTGKLLDIGCLVDPFLNPVPNRNPTRHDVAMVMGACLWIPKSLWRELDGFPEWFESIGEDLYLCFRARLEGYSVLALGNSGYRHRVGRSFGGGKVRENRLATTRIRRRLSERNKSIVITLIYPLPLFQIVLPIHLALLLLEGAALALAKQEYALFRDIYLDCFKALWQERKRLLRVRREIQVRRTIALGEFCSGFVLFPHKLKMLVKHGLPIVR